MPASSAALSQQTLELLAILEQRRRAARARQLRIASCSSRPSAFSLRRRRPSSSTARGSGTPSPLRAARCARAGLEVEPQRALDGDLAVAEVRGREDAADDDLFLLAVLRDMRVSPSLNSARISRMSCARSERNLAALVAEALAHRRPEDAGVDELHLALARSRPCGWSRPRRRWRCRCCRRAARAAR